MIDLPTHVRLCFLFFRLSIEALFANDVNVAIKGRPRGDVEKLRRQF